MLSGILNSKTTILGDSMKKTIKLALGAAVLLSATSAFATNGDNMYALGAKSRGMGGVGIATNLGSESTISNPALINSSEVSFGGTVFMPKVQFKGDVVGQPQTQWQKSKADLSVIPEVSTTYKVNDNFTWGVGMFGVAGMGTDYTDDKATYATLNKANASTQNPSGYTPSQDQSKYMGTQNRTNQMLTNLQLMRFAVPIAYHTNGFSIGIAPILQYGSLSIAYNNGAYYNSHETAHNILTSNGVSQDFGFGYQAGLSYEVSGLTIGATYTSSIDMTYKNQISSATQNFGINNGKGLADNLEQPSEYGIGLSYTVSGNTIAFDYKRINWGDAKGYKDFGWENQNVYALGYEYNANDAWALRLGYNYAKSPIKEQTAANMNTDYDGAAMNYFNMAGFPAIVESTFTLGGSYAFNKTLGLDAAFSYSPEVKATFNTSAMTQAQTFAAMQAGGYTVAEAQGAAGQTTSSASVKHSQTGVTLAMTYKF